MRAQELIAASGLRCQILAFGADVEGDMDQILDVIEQIHEALHEEGIVRLSTSVKIGTRRDKEPTLVGKV